MTPVSLSHMILGQADELDFRKRKPKWIRAQLPGRGGYADLRKLVKENTLHTVCEEARCPNMGECWANGVATIMILGEVCTRSCGFCNVKTGRPNAVDFDEPKRVAESVGIMNLKYVVITSVDRDDLSDGGARIWAETICAVREECPDTKVEVLIPDFKGDIESLRIVAEARPVVLAHNMETVKRLHGPVRPQARYERSLAVLRNAKAMGMTTKTGIMVGIGERDEEVLELMDDIIEKSGCDIFTIGQYLQPSVRHLPVARFVEPGVFEMFRIEGLKRGFRMVESGPMVRSSYHADKMAAALNNHPSK